jgi:hypothetical protein
MLLPTSLPLSFHVVSRAPAVHVKPRYNALMRKMFGNIFGATGFFHAKGLKIVCKLLNHHLLCLNACANQRCRINTNSSFGCGSEID